jgi:transcriptional regulator with XRE-family HTH domain
MVKKLPGSKVDAVPTSATEEETAALVLLSRRKLMIKVIKERMENLKIKQSYLVRKTGLTPSFISRFLDEEQTSQRMIDESILNKLDSALKLDSGLLAAIQKGENPQGDFPSVSFAEALSFLRHNHHSMRDLSLALKDWSWEQHPVHITPLVQVQPLSKELWLTWENGSNLPNQVQLQAIGKMLELDDFERGQLFGLSGIPVNYKTLENETKDALQDVVDEWTFGPAIAIGQPFGLFLKVNKLARDAIKYTEEKIETVLREENPSLLQVHVQKGSFMADYVPTISGFDEQRKRVFALFKTRLALAPYLSHPDVINQLEGYRAFIPKFSELWDDPSLSNLRVSAWDMPMSLKHDEKELDFHAFWSPYLPDQRIEIIHLVPTNMDAVEFVQKRQCEHTAGNNSR